MAINNPGQLDAFVPLSFSFYSEVFILSSRLSTKELLDIESSLWWNCNTRLTTSHKSLTSRLYLSMFAYLTVFISENLHSPCTICRPGARRTKLALRRGHVPQHLDHPNFESPDLGFGTEKYEERFLSRWWNISSKVFPHEFWTIWVWFMRNNLGAWKLSWALMKEVFAFVDDVFWVKIRVKISDDWGSSPFY